VSVPRLSERTAGLLAHLTSLPGPYGCGDLGGPARGFLEFLGRAKQRWWQVLPIGPLGYGNSPYSAQSAFAGSPLMVALEPLVDAGWLARAALDVAPLRGDRVDYAATEALRDALLRQAGAAFFGHGARDPRWRDFVRFGEEEESWLDGFALYRAIKRSQHHVEWTLWPAPLRDRRPGALARAARELRVDVEHERFVQWLFRDQWRALRSASTERGVGLIGDIPIFVAHDSADVWQHRELFHLDRGGMPTVVAGVPPDYFSATGQRWGNPLFRWKRLRKSGYGWWMDRMRSSFARFDAVRIDHFIGFQRYWEIPCAEPTAVNGRWMKGPGADFFEAVRRELGTIQLIAEDLGAVTPAVKRLRDRFGFPGIKILQFAFGTDPNAADFRPHNYRRSAVVYTGTHDNDTTLGWFHEEGGQGSTRTTAEADEERQAALRYLGRDDERDVHWAMMRAAYASVADTAIVPLQDPLGLGGEARMNLPGTASGNWEWRCEAAALTEDLAGRLADLVTTYDRASVDPT
jgi:4-alpha-glucanotransferase